MEYFMDVLKNKYAKFDGRARRSEFWYFYLFSNLAIIVIAILGGILGNISGTLAMICSAVAGIAALAFLVPSIAVAIRRLHDTGKPWFWIFTCLIPVVLIYFLVQDSQPGDNEFGPNPKGLLN